MILSISGQSKGGFPECMAFKTALDPVTRENFRQAVPLGHLGVPGDLAAAVAMFATGAGRLITGQNITVDGGWSAWRGR